MTRRERLSIAGAVVGAILAVLLLLLAVDALRWESRLGAGDVAFEATPRSPGDRWDVTGLLPNAAAEPLLGVGDDLEYRRGVQMFARVAPGEVVIYGPRLENLLGTAQVEIGRLSREDPDARRRSRALNIAGIFQVGRGTSPTNQVGDSAERIAVLRQAIGFFQGAIRLDDENDDAKLNLELALRDAGSAILSGDTPTGNAAEGDRSGAGRAGTGY